MSLNLSSGSKLVNIKVLRSNLVDLESVLRSDLEESNRGLLIFSSTGTLILISWIRKKTIYESIEDVSDAMWQRAGESDVVVACHSGAILGFSLHHSRGIIGTFQLSSSVLLNLIREKDKDIRTTRSPRIWGYTKNIVLMQADSFKLVLISLNSQGKPLIAGILKTPPLRSAHMTSEKILVQSITGSDITIYSIHKCKVIEITALVIVKQDSSYIEWGCMAASSSGSNVALTDSERRLYVACLDDRNQISSKGGICNSSISPRQIVWPANVEPLTMQHIVISLSEITLGLFCSKMVNDVEEFYYFSFQLGSGRSLSLEYHFTTCTVLIPGLTHSLPDLFITKDGVGMLMDQKEKLCRSGSKEDIEKLLKSLQDALHDQDLSKITEIKTNIEQDLSIFLSSCNHLEEWVSLAKERSKQHAKMVDLILSYLTISATMPDRRSNVIGLRELARHHFKMLLDDMTNVMKYVDSDKVSQMLLQMMEQMKFFLYSIDSLHMPDVSQEDNNLIEKFEIWGEYSMRDIIFDALDKKCIGVAETYLKLKPWIYGDIKRLDFISLCLRVAREEKKEDYLMYMDSSYAEEVRSLLYGSNDVVDIDILRNVLKSLNSLSEKESMAACLYLKFNKYTSGKISSPMATWYDLISYDESATICSATSFNVGLMCMWTHNSLVMAIIDLFARTKDIDLVDMVSKEGLWNYLLIREDGLNLSHWIHSELDEKELIKKSETANKLKRTSKRSLSSQADLVSKRKTSRKKSLQSLMDGGKKRRVQHLLGNEIYLSDSESICSLESSLSSCIEDSSLFTLDSLLPYKVSEFPLDWFGFITQGMIDDVNLYCKDSFSENVLNSLAEYYLFQTSDKNPHAILSKLIQLNILDNFYSESLVDLSKYSHRINSKYLDILILNSFASDNLHLPYFEYVCVRKIDISTLNIDEGSRKPWLSLIEPFLRLQTNQDRETLYNFGLENIHYMGSSKRNIVPIAAFLTMLFAPNATLSNFVQYMDNEKEVQTSGCLTQAVSEKTNLKDLVSIDIQKMINLLNSENMDMKALFRDLMKSHSFLLPLLKKSDATSVKIDVSLYDLLRGGIPFDISGLFTWQKCNRFGYKEGNSIPSISDETLSQSDGLKCSLDFYYYLQRGRPANALASVLLEIFSTGSIKRIEDIEGPIFGLALNSWPDNRIVSSCISMLYLADLNYESLRTIFFIANTILEVCEKQGCKLPENLQNSQMCLLSAELKRLLVKLCLNSTRNESASKLLSLHEDALIIELAGVPLTLDHCQSGFLTNNKDKFEKVHDDHMSKSKIFYLMHGIKVECELALLYGLPSPSRILEFLTVNNEWLLFLTMIETFQFPKSAVLRASSSFESVALKEHMQFALSHVHHYRSSKKSEKSNKGLRQARGSLYSRIGIKSVNKRKISDTPDVEDDIDKQEKYSDPSPRSSDDVLTVEDVEADFAVNQIRQRLDSVGSNASGSSLDSIGIDSINVKSTCSITKSCSEADTSIFGESVIFDSSTSIDSKESWHISKEPIDLIPIILKCHRNDNPSISLLEASLFLNAPLLSVFSACYNKDNARACLACWLWTQADDEAKCLYSIEDILDRERGEENREDIIIKCIEFGLVDILIEGLMIFDPDTPLLPIIRAVHLTKLGSPFEDIVDILNECMTNYNQEMGSRLLWMINPTAKIVWFLLSSYLDSSYLQKCFLDAFLPLCGDYPFNFDSKRWNVIHDLCESHYSCQLPLDIVCFLSVEILEDDFCWKILDGLISTAKFECALKIAEILDLNVGKVICAQLYSKFIMKKSYIIKDFRSTNDFFMKVHSILTTKQVSYDEASKLFESMAKECSNFTSFLCMKYSVMWAYKNESPNTTNLSIETITKSVDLSQGHISSNNDFKISVADSGMLEKCKPDASIFNLTYTDISSLKKDRLEYLEEKMWVMFANAFINDETEFQSYGFQPPSPFEKWPWEVKNKLDGLSLSCVKGKSTLLSFENGLRKNPSIEETIVQSQISDEVKLALSKLIELLLNNSFVITPYRISNMFGITHKDLDVLLELLTKASNWEEQKIPSSSSESACTEPDACDAVENGINHGLSISSTFSHLSRDSADGWIGEIVNLSTSVVNGEAIAMRVLMLCEIANSISQPFTDIVNCSNPKKILLDVLFTRNNMLAKDLIEAFPIEEEEVKQVLLEEAVKIICPDGSSEDPNDDSTCSCIFSSISDLEDNWNGLLGLIENATSIGYQLLQVGRSIQSSEDHEIKKIHKMSVELTVLAHSCFSHAANMEAVTVVLNTAHILTNSLLQHRQWICMVRLLTGIRRYKEMSYIIDLLKENEQFEHLLGHTSERKCRNGALEGALVHYLRSKYPEDAEMLRMVALHFLMYSEVSKMLEEEAENIINDILSKTECIKLSSVSTPERRGMFGLSESLEGVPSAYSESDSATLQVDYLYKCDIKRLTEAMHAYARAAHYFLQEQHLTSAVKNSRNAELVALQIALVKDSCMHQNALKIVHLKVEEVRVILERYLNVEEIILVARAYEVNIDWAASLYYNYICKGSERFVEEFFQKQLITPEIVTDIVKKIEIHGLNPSHLKRFSSLLYEVKECDVVYRIASQLGLKDVLDRCLRLPSKDYLKDTVFTKGYSS